MIDQTAEDFIQHTHEGVEALFGKEWRSVHARLEEILDLKIAPPKPISRLDQDMDDIRDGSFTTHDHWTETQWTEIEGQWLKRSAARFTNWLFGGERRWGRRKETVSYSEHTVNIGQIHQASQEQAKILGANMNAYMAEMLEQLRNQTTHYAKDVQMRVQSINTYILEEIRRGSDESEANLERRRMTAQLAVQARDLITEAIAIRDVVKESQHG